MPIIHATPQLRNSQSRCFIHKWQFLSNTCNFCKTHLHILLKNQTFLFQMSFSPLKIEFVLTNGALQNGI